MSPKHPASRRGVPRGTRAPRDLTVGPADGPDSPHGGATGNQPFQGTPFLSGLKLPT